MKKKLRVYTIADDYRVWEYSLNIDPLIQLANDFATVDLEQAKNNKKSFRVSVELMDEKDYEIAVKNLQAANQPTDYDRAVLAQKLKKEHVDFKHKNPDPPKGKILFLNKEVNK